MEPTETLNTGHEEISRSEVGSTGYANKIIAIASGKGGVGKSILTVNLGLALVKSGKKVLVIDGDLGLANVNVLLGFIPKFNLYHVMKGHRSIRDIVYHSPEGLDVIPGANGYSQFTNLDEASRNHLIKSFSELDGYDYVLIDTGAGIGANVIAFSLFADDILLVITSDPTSVTDAFGLIKSLVTIDKSKKISFIVNQIKTELEGNKVVKRITEICQKFLGFKPANVGFLYQDEAVDKSVRKQKPFLFSAPNSKAAENLYQIAGTIANIPLDPSRTQPKIMVYFKKFLHFLIPSK